jgi:phospholipid transport system substrate-binding protein
MNLPINRYMKSALLVLMLWQIPAPVAAAETPKQQLQATMERVMAVTRTFQSAADFENNKARLKQIILPRFDFTEMARRSLGSYWSGLQGKEKEFLAAFVQFAEASYMNALGSYRGEKMVYGREQIDSNFAEIDTEVLNSRGDGTPITYKLHLVRGQWKVYDVIIEQVSLVSNYRSQFSRILQTASMDELMRRLREKASAQTS